MRNKPKLDYNSIEDTPANELLELSHEELDGLIVQANEISVNASMIINWLRAIKFEKEVRDSSIDPERGAAK